MSWVGRNDGTSLSDESMGMGGFRYECLREALLASECSNAGKANIEIEVLEIC